MLNDNGDQEEITAEQIFQEDVQEKSIIARSAHVRYGSGGNMMSRQEEEGPVTKYELNRPMKWREFKALPKDIQTLYMQNLYDKYQVGPTALAKMFGLAPNTISTHCKTNKLNIIRKTWKTDPKYEKRFLVDFCGIDPTEIMSANLSPLKEIEPKLQPSMPLVNATSPMPTWLKTASLTLNGPLDAFELAKMLSTLVPEGEVVRMKIDIESGDGS
jgi:hypothetical protein